MLFLIVNWYMIWFSDNFNDIFSRIDLLDFSLCSSSLFIEFLIMFILVFGIDFL